MAITDKEKAELRKRFAEWNWDELINILGEMVIGNNEGKCGDRIWSQELLERLKRLKYED